MVFWWERMGRWERPTLFSPVLLLVYKEQDDTINKTRSEHHPVEKREPVVLKVLDLPDNPAWRE
jgi:hypothetical protein